MHDRIWIGENKRKLFPVQGRHSLINHGWFRVGLSSVWCFDSRFIHGLCLVFSGDPDRRCSLFPGRTRLAAGAALLPGSSGLLGRVLPGGLGLHARNHDGSPGRLLPDPLSLRRHRRRLGRNRGVWRCHRQQHRATDRIISRHRWTEKKPKMLTKFLADST